MTTALKPGSPALQSEHPQAQNLLSAWIAHEGSGSQLHDFGPYGRNGAFAAANGGLPVWGDGYYGAEVLFEDEGMVSIADAALYAPTAFTVVTMFRITNAPSVLLRDMTLLEAAHGSSPDRAYYVHVRSADNKITFIAYNSSSTPFTVVSDSAVSEETDYHVVATLSADGTMALYVDGVKQADTDTLTGTLLAPNGLVQVGNASEYLDGALIMAAVHDTDVDGDWVAEHYHDPFAAFRENVLAYVSISPTFGGVDEVGAGVDEDITFIARYTDKDDGPDLVNDYGLEECEWVQDSNMQEEVVKYQHGSRIAAGALGVKTLSLRGVFFDDSVSTAYLKLNRLSAHMKILTPSKLWLWTDRMLWVIGGDIQYTPLKGTAGHGFAWTAQVIAMDPYFTDDPAGNSDTEGVYSTGAGSVNTYLNKGNAPVWPTFLVTSTVKTTGFFEIVNESLDPYWPLYINLIRDLDVGDTLLIDGFTRQVTHWDESASKTRVANDWIGTSDHIWMEGGPNGKYTTLRFKCGVGGGTVTNYWPNKWY